MREDEKIHPVVRRPIDRFLDFRKVMLVKLPAVHRKRRWIGGAHDRGAEEQNEEAKRGFHDGEICGMGFPADGIADSRAGKPVPPLHATFSVGLESALGIGTEPEWGGIGAKL